MFQKVDAYAGDPILSLMERFKEDPRSDKVNLSIGLYYNEDGIIPQLKAVAEAEARLNAVPHGASLYLPMEGLNAYRNTIAPLLFGADHAVLLVGGHERRSPGRAPGVVPTRDDRRRSVRRDELGDDVEEPAHRVDRGAVGGAHFVRHSVERAEVERSGVESEQSVDHRPMLPAKSGYRRPTRLRMCLRIDRDSRVSMSSTNRSGQLRPLALRPSPTGWRTGTGVCGPPWRSSPAY